MSAPSWNPTRCAFMVKETDTHLVEIVPMIFNHRVVLTPKAHLDTYDAGWCYPSMATALQAVLGWDPATQPEPTGYVKRAV